MAEVETQGGNFKDIFSKFSSNMENTEKDLEKNVKMDINKELGRDPSIGRGRSTELVSVVEEKPSIPITVESKGNFGNLFEKFKQQDEIAISTPEYLTLSQKKKMQEEAKKKQEEAGKKQEEIKKKLEQDEIKASELRKEVEKKLQKGEQVSEELQKSLANMDKEKAKLLKDLEMAEKQMDAEADAIADDLKKKVALQKKGKEEEAKKARREETGPGIDLDIVEDVLPSEPLSFIMSPQEIAADDIVNACIQKVDEKLTSLVDKSLKTYADSIDAEIDATRGFPLPKKEEIWPPVKYKKAFNSGSGVSLLLDTKEAIEEAVSIAIKGIPKYKASFDYEADAIQKMKDQLAEELKDNYKVSEGYKFWKEEEDEEEEKVKSTEDGASGEVTREVATNNPVEETPALVSPYLDRLPDVAFVTLPMNRDADVALDTLKSLLPGTVIQGIASVSSGSFFNSIPKGAISVLLIKAKDSFWSSSVEIKEDQDFRVAAENAKQAGAKVAKALNKAIPKDKRLLSGIIVACSPGIEKEVVAGIRQIYKTTPLFGCSGSYDEEEKKAAEAKRAAEKPTPPASAPAAAPAPATGGDSSTPEGEAEKEGEAAPTANTQEEAKVNTTETSPPSAPQETAPSAEGEAKSPTPEGGAVITPASAAPIPAEEPKEPPRKKTMWNVFSDKEIMELGVCLIGVGGAVKVGGAVSTIYTSRRKKVTVTKSIDFRVLKLNEERAADKIIEFMGRFLSKKKREEGGDIANEALRAPLAIEKDILKNEMPIGTYFEPVPITNLKKPEGSIDLLGILKEGQTLTLLRAKGQNRDLSEATGEAILESYYYAKKEYDINKPQACLYSVDHAVVKGMDKAFPGMLREYSALVPSMPSVFRVSNSEIGDIVDIKKMRHTFVESFMSCVIIFEENGGIFGWVMNPDLYGESTAKDSERAVKDALGQAKKKLTGKVSGVYVMVDEMRNLKAVNKFIAEQLPNVPITGTYAAPGAYRNRGIAIQLFEKGESLTLPLQANSYNMVHLNSYCKVENMHKKVYYHEMTQFKPPPGSDLFKFRDSDDEE